MVNSQRYKECEFPGCIQKGRILARMGKTELAYCPKHRKKYGERIINALINSRFNYKLSRFLTEIKTDIFMGGDVLSVESGSKLKSYILNKSVELDNLIRWGEENDAHFGSEIRWNPVQQRIKELGYKIT